MSKKKKKIKYNEAIRKINKFSVVQAISALKYYNRYYDKNKEHNLCTHYLLSV